MRKGTKQNVLRLAAHLFLILNVPRNPKVVFNATDENGNEVKTSKKFKVDNQYDNKDNWIAIGKMRLDEETKLLEWIGGPATEEDVLAIYEIVSNKKQQSKQRRIERLAQEATVNDQELVNQLEEAEQNDEKNYGGDDDGLENLTGKELLIIQIREQRKFNNTLLMLLTQLTEH